MKKIVFVVINIITISFMVMFAFFPKKTFSENENRMLETFPKFSLDTLKSGKYISRLEVYLTDHFPFRDFFVGLKSESEKLLGKEVINDIYLGKDNYLLTKYNKINPEKLIDTLNNFASNNSDRNISLILVPSSISVYKEKLPYGAITDSETDVISSIYDKVNVNTIDVLNALTYGKKEGAVFYRTDHHYTTYGAYLVYTMYAKNNGIVPRDLDYFDINKVSDDFYGTLYSKSNDYTILPDEMYLFNTKTNYEVIYDNDKLSNSLYEYSYLDKKDKYSVFLDNNHGLTEIINKDIDNDKEILIIKDSYGNSLSPFIAEHYHKVHMVDLRYNLNSMSKYLEENANISDILIIYSINTIDENSSIYYLR